MSTSLSGRSAAELHAVLKSALIAMQRAERAAVLCFAEINERRLYRELGYSSIHMYAAEALGLTEKLHEPLFEAMHKKRQKLYDKNALIDFAVEHGVDRQKFSDALHQRERHELLDRHANLRHGLRGVGAPGGSLSANAVQEPEFREVPQVGQQAGVTP